jgi:thioredoxin reductase
MIEVSKETTMNDLIILGGGPAGLTAAAYSLHKRLETLVISEDLGGKTSYRFRTPWMEGYEAITGTEVVNRFKSQLEYLDFAHEMDRVVKVVKTGNTFAVLTNDQKRFETRAIVVATGTSPNRLTVPGERQLLGRGLSYSALSHAPLFIDRNVALIGQGPRALRGAAELAVVARSLVLILPDPQDLSTALGKKLQSDPKVKIVNGYNVQEILGDSFVKGIALRHNGTAQEIALEGLFVEMGMTPNTEMVADLVTCSPSRRIIVDARMATSCPGIFAAGDVTETYTEQVLVAIGEGAKAALNAYEYLLEQVKG